MMLAKKAAIFVTGAALVFVVMLFWSASAKGQALDSMGGYSLPPGDVVVTEPAALDRSRSLRFEVDTPGQAYVATDFGAFNVRLGIVGAYDPPYRKRSHHMSQPLRNDVISPRDDERKGCLCAQVNAPFNQR